MNAPQMKAPLREGFQPEIEAPEVLPPISERPAPPTREAPPLREVPQEPTEAAPELQLEPLPDTWPVTVRLLQKKIRNNKNELIDKVIFREPTGGDINRIGNPIRVDLKGEIIIDDQKMVAMIAQLSGLLPPMVEQMDPRDYASCAYRLRGFFLPDPAAWREARTKT